MGAHYFVSPLSVIQLSIQQIVTDALRRIVSTITVGHTKGIKLSKCQTIMPIPRQ